MRARLVDGYPLDVATRRSAPVFGIEHEYCVYDGDAPLDFAPLLHRLPLEGVRLDPTDPNAYRTPWGGLVTADGREAEVATAPVPLGPGCTHELEWRAAVAQHVLAAALPAELRLDGYSTHLNLEVDDRDVVAAGRLFVRHFAPAMMLFLDRAHSPGLLVRPRGGRLEVGGEYCTGDQLRAAVTFAAAGGLTCAGAVRSPDRRRHLPRAVRARVRPANIRAGWYVDRGAFGVDLYRHGRSTPLRTRHGGVWTAQDHLVDAWQCARATAEPLLSCEELVIVDRAVDGVLALPLEDQPRADEVTGPFAMTAFGHAVAPRARPGYRVEPLSIAWEAIAFRLHGVRDGVACIPRAALGEFLDELDAGRLDITIQTFLASPPGERVLSAAEQTTRPGLFDELRSPDAIVPPERVPGRPHRAGRGGGTPRDSRRDKSRRPSRPRRALVAAGAIVAVALLATVVLVTTRDGTRSVSTTGLAGVPPGAVPARFNVVFTVASTNVGAHYTGETPPAVGSRVTAPVVAACSTTCTFGNPPGAGASAPFLDLGLPFTASGDSLHASTDASGSSPNCPHVNAVHETVSVQLQRDTAGKVTGFRGIYELTHPGGVEETTAAGTCSTFDISYSFVGTPA